MDHFPYLCPKLFHLHSTFSILFGTHFKHMKPKFLEFMSNAHCNLALPRLADLLASSDHLAQYAPSETGW